MVISGILSSYFKIKIFFIKHFSFSWLNSKFLAKKPVLGIFFPTGLFLFEAGIFNYEGWQR